jgi:drug/metabolite transporter (DMT)-like permease
MAELALALLSLAWGTTFTIVNRVLVHTSPGLFLTLRFAVAAGALGLVAAARAAWRRRPADRVVAASGAGLLREGGLIGLAMAGGFVLQTEGLRLTTAARSGFLTAFYVLGVPLLARGLFGRPIGRSTWLGVALATAGVALLGASGGAPTAALRAGDLLTVLSAFCFAVQIVLVTEWSARHDLMALTLVQLGVTLAAAAAVAALEPRRLTAGPGLAAAVAFTGLAMTAAAFLVQNWAQRRTSAVRAALIYALEPVAAAVFAHTVGGDPLPPFEVAGGALVVLGVVTVTWPRRSRTPGSPTESRTET